MSRHECKWWKPNGPAGWRGHRWCGFCGRQQVKVRRRGALVWEDELSLRSLAGRWLPAISGTHPDRLMSVQVAYPFEWNCHETWNIVYKVVFQFPHAEPRALTRVHVMNGWQSGWHEYFNHIDAEAEDYYQERTGRWYDIGDNAYAEMREIIQSPVPEKPTEPPGLHAV